MSGIAVRPYTEADAEPYFEIRSLTYNNGDPIPPERRVFKYVRPFVAEHLGEVKGAYVVLDMNATRGPATLGCGGIASVGVLPHHRRLGIGKEMMTSAVRTLRDEGTPLASLYAFRESYYRIFGYETCGMRLKLACPAVRLPNASGELPLRRLRPADWSELHPCYRAFAHARSGLHIRSEKYWNRVLAENRELTIYAAGDPVEAYIVVSHSVGFFETNHISEVAWSSMRGYRTLLEILRSIGINKAGLSWYEPSDSPYLAQYMDQGVDVTVERPIMFRACDAPLALRSLKPDVARSGSFTLSLRDEIIPENRGPWRVSFSDGAVEVERSSDAELEMDIRQFAQALLGSPSLEDLSRNQLVQVRSGEAFEAARALLPPSPVYCMDFF